MKISKNTQSILTNFSILNPNLFIRTGNVLTTVSINSSVYVKATVEETFTKECCIYNLRNFLDVVKFFESVDIEFADKHMVLKDGKYSVNYIYADPSLIKKSKGDVRIPEPFVRLKVSETQLDSILRSASTLDLPSLLIQGQAGENVKMVVKNFKVESSNSLVIDCEETASENFKMFFNIDNFKMIDGDYNLSIAMLGENGVGHFVNDKMALEYYISTELGSERK